ncbi:MAG: Rne/Rng family ribonuclease [Firmicutes bacterium]|nr:Rne/Rng family ribonuclease [Bacillota bacterium]
MRLIKEIIIDASFGQIRTALLEDGELTEIHVEGQEGHSIVGSIYKGKTENVLQGMQAAFVDIGEERNAFLYIKDVLPNFFSLEDEDIIEPDISYDICDLLKSGQEILVQVVKDPIDSKGARITTHITLPGRYTVLMPTVDYIGISRRIGNEAERNRLKEMVESVKPDNMGIIVRTVAENCNIEKLETDIKFLMGLWQDISNKSNQVSAPKLVHKDMDLFYRTLRDMFTYDTERLIVNEESFFNKALEITNNISPTLLDRIKYFNKSYDIFGYYNIDEKLEKLLGKKIWLKSGGYIVIEQTEALTVVDVNTGKYIGGKNLKDTALKTNIEAAREIAGQLRLRDIGGIIIIDFIDMEDEEHQNLVIEVMKNALKNDRSKSCIWGITHLGLLEMTRKKVVPSKEDKMLSHCPYCMGSGKIISSETMIKLIEKDLKKLLLHEKGTKNIKIEVHPEIKKNLVGYLKYIDIVAKTESANISMSSNNSLQKDKYNIILKK